MVGERDARDWLRVHEARLHKIGAVGLLAIAFFAGYNWPDAVATPLGPVYFVEPYPALVQHELCHMERMEEMGWAKFYIDYLAGGAAEEEMRCFKPGMWRADE